MLHLQVIVDIIEKMKDQRLDKFLADRLGYTRKQSRTLIKSGRVLVNNASILDLSYKVCENDLVLYDDNVFTFGDKFYYYLMNKPEDYVTATYDNRHSTIFELLPKSFIKLKIMPVGRLDIDTTGLLLLTNDGKLTFRLLSPKREIYKTYIVNTDVEVEDDALKSFSVGINLGDFITKPANIVRLNDNTYEIAICEGKFHQVKRMFEAVGVKVIKLQRVSFGPITLDIPIGEYRELNTNEIDILYKSCDLERNINE